MYQTEHIVTNQFVRIDQETVGLPKRMAAQLIDYAVVIAYIFFITMFLEKLERHIPNEGVTILLTIVLLLLPSLGYFVLCETFNEGQTIGKRIVHIKVVKKDGTAAGVGDYLLRGLLLPIDTFGFFYIGAWFIILTKHHQRLGDLAAGTVVVRVKRQRKIAINIDEYAHLSQNYTPRYPQAANLSFEQSEIIARVLTGKVKDKGEQARVLAEKVKHLLRIDATEGSPEQFLDRVVKDYQHYAVEML